MRPFVQLSSSSPQRAPKSHSIEKVERTLKAVMFSSSALSKEEVEIHLEEEHGNYTTGDHIRGFIVIQNRHWRHARVEALLTCEEHAELDPEQCNYTDFENRRLTFAGETIDGDPADESTADYGIFNFDLRLLDDLRAPYIMPSFEVEHDRLLNAIRWFVVVKVATKQKSVSSQREINVIPSYPLPVSCQLKGIKKELEFSSPASKKFWRSRNSQGSQKLTGILQVPNYRIAQRPASIPLKLVLTISEPRLIILQSIKVEWTTDMVVKIREGQSKFPLTETLASCELNEMAFEQDALDLSGYVPACYIENACPGFRGKWLTLVHSLMCTIEYKIPFATETETLKISSPMDVMSPHTKDMLVDSPPVYSPSNQQGQAEFHSVDEILSAPDMG